MRRAALAVALLACGHRSPPAPRPTPPPVTTPPAAPSRPPPPAMAACAPAAPRSGRFLTVRARYAVGARARIEPRCDRLTVFTETGGRRLFDPATGIMSAPLPDRTGPGRAYAAGGLVIEEAGRACQPGCAVIAHDATTGDERWRRACPCHEKGLKLAELYESMSAVDGKIIATELERHVEAWDAKDGHTIWSRPDDHAIVVGGFVVLDRAAPQRVTLLDGNGKELTRVRAAQPQIEAMAADADTFFIASSDASEYGGMTNDVIEGFEVPTGKRAWSTTLKSVVRRYASTPPSLWAEAGGPIYFFEIDNGFLTTIDRSGQVLSAIGMAGLTPVRTQTGFAAIDDEGVIAVLEPSDIEVPPASHVVVEGTLTLDGKPMPNIDVVVGDVRTKTGAGGRYSAALTARGRFWVKTKQPTASNNTAYWANADAVVEVDGRTGSYVVNLDAKRDTLE
jgi:hypothetical protein